MHFLKFEDDTKSAITGNDVWAHLATSGDAVLPAAHLAGGYLHKLLDLTARNYSLSEVTEKFWRDPTFPLIPSDSIARRAIFEALRPDDDGAAWELVTATGEPLMVRSPDELALNASNQFLRIAQPASEPEPAPTGDGPTPQPTGSVGGSGGGATPGDGGADGPSGTGVTVYKVHELVLANKSLTDRDAREKLFQLLSELADVIDPSSGKDVQVATIRLEINAAAGSLDNAGEKAREAGAVWDAHDEDF